MNARLKGAVLAVGLAAGGVVTVAAPAQAEDYQPPQVFNVAPIVPASNGTATVTATYQCFGGDGGGSHLYIGVKQGPGVNTTNHSTSASSTTFYSTNWNFDSGPGLTATCDGTVRTDSFVVMDDPFWAHVGEAPALHTGAALVQFCLFDSTNSGEEGDETGFAWKYSMRGVLAS
jgi:hypothetical protein